MEDFAGHIQIRPSWNNLVDLPSALTSLLYNANISPQEVIVELVLQDQHKSYVGWSAMNSSGAKNIGIDPIFAQSLKLANKLAVKLNLKIKNYKSNSIFLEPEHSQDWELVELHAATIEAKLIEQSRCVAMGQVLVVYPTKTSSVRLQVTDIGNQAHTYALIDPYAEISIAPKLREKKKPKEASSENSARSTRSSADETNHGPYVLKRGVSLPHPLFSSLCMNSQITSYELFVNRDEFIHVFQHHDFVSVSVIAGPLAKQNKTPSDVQEKREPKFNAFSSLLECNQVIARLRHMAVPFDHVGLSEGLAVALGVEKEVGYKVVVRQAWRNLSKKPSNFILYPYVTQTKPTKLLNLNSAAAKKEQAELSNIISERLFWHQRINESPITNYLKVPVIPEILPLGGLLVMTKKGEKNTWIKPFDIQTQKNLPKVEVKSDLLRGASFIQNTIALGGELDTAYESEQIIEDAVEQISLFENTGVMIHGPSGSGKSLLLNWIAKSSGDKFAYYTRHVRCETMMNESQDQIVATFSKIFNDAVWHEPSLIVLDNLDKILCAETENGDSRMSNQLVEIFVSQQQRIAAQTHTKVSLLASGCSKESFNRHLSQSHLFDHHVYLRAPDKKTRAIMLEQYASRLGCKLGFDVMDAVQETEGYLPKDLNVLSERMYFKSLYSLQSEDTSEGPESLHLISKAVYEKAHSGHTPSNLRGVKLEKSTASWQDIGGLSEPKRVLLETLEWPTKYSPIFASCPLRLRSGILLYGYPGCGKTLLASAIAAQCGLNFISIKGPEILNKYIGASEQSVRELFDRAQSAKPCVLFFDEFDSIAPKRGHDSTGVTDRVVNQMLTQMDGAEGLDGVYVLAATSRPDLIDSALLRPGRLDKSVICDMPNYDDRKSILDCICQKLDLESGVDLSEVATLTKGYSGADMQGICYNAYLKAVHDKLASQEETSLGKSQENEAAREFFQISHCKLLKLRPAERMALHNQVEKIFEGSNSQTQRDSTQTKFASPTVPISHAHFLASFKETKPSISPSEKNKLERIYSQFLIGRDGNMPDGRASNDIGARTTLM